MKKIINSGYLTWHHIVSFRIERIVTFSPGPLSKTSKITYYSGPPFNFLLYDVYDSIDYTMFTGYQFSSNGI